MMIIIIDTLTSNRTVACVTIELLEDDIVEVDEVFLVQVEQVRSSDDLLIGLSPEFTEITVIDNDGKQKHFPYLFILFVWKY